MEFYDYISLITAIVAMIVSMVALIYTVKTYLLKKGSNIRGAYTTCSSITCEDKYISSILLENYKDRAIIIFKIYLKIGHNYFIEIDNFEDKPLVLNPFEVFKKEYDPIDFYSVNTSRISINNLIDNKKVKKQIILSTSNGKYKVRKKIRHWSPNCDFFKNYMTGIIHIKRCTYKGKSYGLNLKYIVTIKYNDESEEVIPIYPNDYEIKKFKKFNLTEEALKSSDLLEEFMNNQIQNHLLKCKSFSVIDIEKWRKETYDNTYNLKEKQGIEARYYNWFIYNVYGRFLTIYKEYKLERDNRKLQKNWDKHYLDKNEIS